MPSASRLGARAYEIGRSLRSGKSHTRHLRRADAWKSGRLEVRLFAKGKINREMRVCRLVIAVRRYLL